MSGITNILSYGLTSFIMKSTVGIFDDIFDNVLSFGARFINVMKISFPAAIVTLMVSMPLTFIQSLIDIIIQIGKKGKRGNRGYSI